MVKTLPFAPTRLSCPYCYESFGETEIQFRCGGRTSRTGRRCDPEPDQVLARRTGFSGALPPTFSADGRRTEAVCPDCGATTPNRICPSCHMQLPVHFGKVSGRMIALVGARETGKTVFVTVLVHELMYRIGDRFDAAVVGADDETRHRFTSDYEGPLYRQAQLQGATRPADMYGRRPLVFRFTTARKWFTGGARHTLLSVFDTAGEDMTSQQDVDMNVRYLGSADGVILVLDPLQMRGARTLVSPGTRLPGPARGVDEPVNVLARITDLMLKTGQRGPRQLIAKPIAVVFTKLDALWQTFPDGSPLRRPEPNGAHFSETDSLDVHAQIQALLHQWDGEPIEKQLSRNYRRYRYFGVSALGESPTPGNRVSPRGVLPYRVADPFLWLLSEFGAIRARRG